MNYTEEDYKQAAFQLESLIHKLQRTIETFEGKENPERYKSQITLAKRRIAAFELSLSLINRAEENGISHF